MSTISASTTSTTAYKVAADTTGTLVLQTGSSPTTAVTIDGSQNVGIGTNTINTRLHVHNGSGGGVSSYFTDSTTTTSSGFQVGLDSGHNAILNMQYNAQMLFSTNNSERMRISSSGNVGIGTTVTNGRLNVYGPSVYQAIYNTDASGNDTHSATIQAYGTYWNKLVLDGSQLIFNAYGVERARIDTNGNLLVGSTSSSIAASPGIKLGQSATAATIGIVTDTAANTGSYHLYNVNATNNGYRFYVNTNGGISNFSANNVNLSDERTKTDIQDAGGYLAKICAIPVRTFKYKDQTDDLLNLGVIAQEVEAVAPELVDVSGFGETPEDGVPLKAIYQTDLQYALMKCIQELKAELDAAKADIATLKGAA